MNKKIIVFGGCSVDNTYIQNKDKSYNEKPTKVVFGGKGANQAVASSRAGADVYIITRLGGKDFKEKEIANSIIKNFKDNKVNTDYIEVLDNVVNDVSQIKVSSTGENDISRKTGAIDSFTVDMIKKYENVLRSASFIVAQAKTPKEVTEELVNFCHKNKLFLILTPCRPLKLRGEIELIEKINLITCNYEECCKIFGDVSKDDKGNDKYSLTERQMENILKKYPNKLIVTLGSRGVVYFDGNEIVKIPPLEVANIVDSTGAGDTLNGNMIASLAQGKKLKDAIIDGVYAATYKIQYSCAQSGMPTKKQRESFKKQLEK